MTTLTEFLLARIAEREMLARDMQHMAAIGRPLLELRGGGTLGRDLVDPARVLAECEAKREVVNAAGYHLEFGRVTPESEDLALSILRALALPYADHPDYRMVRHP